MIIERLACFLATCLIILRRLKFRQCEIRIIRYRFTFWLSTCFILYSFMLFISSLSRELLSYTSATPFSFFISSFRLWIPHLVVAISSYNPQRCTWGKHERHQNLIRVRSIVPDQKTHIMPRILQQWQCSITLDLPRLSSTASSLLGLLSAFPESCLGFFAAIDQMCSALFFASSETP